MLANRVCLSTAKLVLACVVAAMAPVGIFCALASDDPARIIPIRIGYDWADVQAQANENIRLGNSH